MAAEIPALKVCRDSAVVSSSGSWFHSLMLDGKKILYMSWSCSMGLCTCTEDLLRQHLIAGGVERLG